MSLWLTIFDLIDSGWHHPTVWYIIILMALSWIWTKQTGGNIIIWSAKCLWFVELTKSINDLSKIQVKLSMYVDVYHGIQRSVPDDQWSVRTAFLQTVMSIRDSNLDPSWPQPSIWSFWISYVADPKYRREILKSECLALDNIAAL